MKPTSPLLMLVLLLAIAAPCPAQKYHDALLNNVKGPVKQLIDEEDLLYEYDDNGAVVAHYYDNSKETAYGIKCERDAQGYVTKLHMFHDKACTDFFYTTVYQYNDKRQIVSYTEQESGSMETRSVYFIYDSNGNIAQRKIYIDGELVGTIEYNYESFDEWGNWRARSAHYDIDDSVDDELRFISYWKMPEPESAPVPEPAPASTTTPAPAPAPQTAPAHQAGEQSAVDESYWNKYIGKPLYLTLYGISKNGEEVNQIICTSDEYIKLDSNGILYWGNRHDGDTSYLYRIDGNRIYLTQISGKKTSDRWIELTWEESYGQIKTESSSGTYRYFCLDE